MFSGCEPGLPRLSGSGSRGEGRLVCILWGISGWTPLSGPHRSRLEHPGSSMPCCPCLPPSLSVGPRLPLPTSLQRKAWPLALFPPPLLPPSPPQGCGRPTQVSGQMHRTPLSSMFGEVVGGAWAMGTQAWGALQAVGPGRPSGHVYNRCTPFWATSQVHGLQGHPCRVGTVSGGHRACCDLHISALAETPQSRCGLWARVVMPHNRDSGREPGRPQAPTPTPVPAQPRSWPGASASPTPALAQVWGVHEASRDSLACVPACSWFPAGDRGGAGWPGTLPTGPPPGPLLAHSCHARGGRSPLQNAGP